MNGTATNRVFGLDILRAAAILFVLQIHSLEFFKPYINAQYYWYFILDGVDLFFVLSGFLIGGILLRTITNKGFAWPELVSFWKRRWFRTLPNYFLLLIILLIGYYYAFHRFPDKTLQFFFFLQNFAGPQPHFFPESWSLAVEEWFYILVPLGLFMLLKTGANKQRVVLVWICFVLVAATSFRLYKAYTFHFTPDHSWDAEIRKLVITRMDSIMYGFLGAWLYHYQFDSWKKRKNLLFILGLLLLYGSRYLYSFDREYGRYFYISVQSIGTLCLLPKLSLLQSAKGMIATAVTFISIISYSMYLLNYTIVLKIIIPGINRLTGMNYKEHIADSVISYILFWLITIAGAYFLYRFYEKPMMNLRERFKKRPAKA